MRYLTLGRTCKAFTDESGRHLIDTLATGPDVDRAGERCTSAFLAQLGEAARAGQVVLTPSHDVPLPLARSVDAVSDDDGQLHIPFEVEDGDPLGMRVWSLIHSGSLRPTVSIGAEKVERLRRADGTVEIASLMSADDELGVHVALAFPGREIYPQASVTGAIVKAAKAGGAEAPAELRRRGWSAEAIARAYDASGEWVPPSFGQRLAEWRRHDEMPELLAALQWTIEEILSPYAGGDTRALLRTSFREFETHVLGQAPDPEPEPAEPKASSTPTPPATTRTTETETETESLSPDERDRLAAAVADRVARSLIRELAVKDGEQETGAPAAEESDGPPAGAAVEPEPDGERAAEPEAAPAREPQGAEATETESSDPENVEHAHPPDTTPDRAPATGCEGPGQATSKADLAARIAGLEERLGRMAGSDAGRARVVQQLNALKVARHRTQGGY